LVEHDRLRYSESVAKCSNINLVTSPQGTIKRWIGFGHHWFRVVDWTWPTKRYQACNLLFRDL